ncbi:MAG: DUF3526 domain-containing protein [Acidobacteriota bacterium]
MIARLFRLELRAIRSDGRSVALLVIALAMLVLSAWIGADARRVADEGRAQALEVSRAQWESIQGLSAHAVGHYGSYVYKPGGALAALDGGVMPFTGKVVRVEAHVQTPPSHSDASSWSSLVRLGAFDAGSILAHVLPLLLAFTAFSSVARDRETGLLRSLVAQGVPLRDVLWGKVLAYWALALVLVAALTVTHVGIDLTSGGALTGDTIARLTGFAGSHAIHLLVVVVLSVGVSAWVADSRAALAILTIAWLGATVILPRITAQLGSQLYPLSSQVEFEDAMKVDRSKGLDGHDPHDERRLALQQQILDEYGVQNARELPVNIGGLLMQADDEYGDKVWDHHFGNRHATVRKQIGVTQAVAFLNPYQAVRGLSMAFAGTDQFHDVQFQRQAENYRRVMVGTLNNLDATAGRRENGRWIRDEIDYADIADFQFETQQVGFALGNRWPELLALIAWAVASVVMLNKHAGRIPVVGAGR